MRIDGDLAEQLIQGARRRGADSAEAYLRTSKNLTIEAKEQKIEAAESSVDFGYSLRVIRDGSVGFSYATDAAEAERVVEHALEASRWTERDAYLDMAEPSPDQSVEIFDAAIASVREEEAIERALLIEKGARDRDSRVTKVRKAGASFTLKEVMIMNSNGLCKTSASTSASAQVMVVAEEGSDSQMGWDYCGSRYAGDVPFDVVGRNAAERALRLLGARRMNPVKAHVILDNSIAVEFLGIFASLLSSEMVQKGKSLLAGKTGRRVVNPLITIIDDGTIPRRLGSRPFDDDGVPTTKKSLIEEGVLRTYLYNRYTAKKEGVRSTGNSVRAGFASLPTVGPSNLYIPVPSSSVKAEALPSAADSCLCVTEAMGLHTANPVSGEFSVGVSGIWIENGIPRHPVKEAVLSGNILDFFNNVVAVGDDLTFYGNIAAPSLLMGPTDISG